MKEEELSKNKKSYLIYDNLPDLKIKPKTIKIYFFNILFFILILFFLWKISTQFWFGALIGQLIITIIAVAPLIYLTTKIPVIRKKYREKYKKRAFQRLFYRYLLITQVPTFISFYFPLVLKTDYFLPNILALPEHSYMKSIFPIYVALPLFIIFLLIGFLVRRPSGGFNIDFESCIFLMYPEKGKIIKQGIYRYIRHPRYLGRVFVSLSFGFFANNVIGLGVSIIHFSAFIVYSYFEDKELRQRFGEEYITYYKSVPGYIPKFSDWRFFIKEVFKR